MHRLAYLSAMRLRQVRHSKRAVLARVEAEYEALDRVVRRLRPADFRRPIPGFGARARVLRERWTAKDALAHIVEWKRQTWRGLARLGSDPGSHPPRSSCSIAGCTAT